MRYGIAQQSTAEHGAAQTHGTARRSTHAPGHHNLVAVEAAAHGHLAGDGVGPHLLKALCVCAGGTGFGSACGHEASGVWGCRCRCRCRRRCRRSPGGDGLGRIGPPALPTILPAPIHMGRCARRSLLLQPPGPFDEPILPLGSSAHTCTHTHAPSPPHTHLQAVAVLVQIILGVQVPAL